VSSCRLIRGSRRSGCGRWRSSLLTACEWDGAGWRAGLAARPSLGEVLRVDAPRYRVLSTAYSQEVQCSAKTSLRRVLKATAVRAIPTLDR
jgi:hypothetical protein